MHLKTKNKKLWPVWCLDFVTFGQVSCFQSLCSCSAENCFHHNYVYFHKQIHVASLLGLGIIIVSVCMRVCGFVYP